MQIYELLCKTKYFYCRFFLTGVPIENLNAE